MVFIEVLGGAKSGWITCLPVHPEGILITPLSM
jgi:hypothetical protein